jgi:TonB-linked SusC/RagA family outer membrane protein
MRKIMLLFAFFGLLGVQVFAQKTITGTVTSADDGSTLPGVSVLVKGTTIATVTDINGKYVLKNVPNDAKTLVFSFMGMQTQEVPINGDVVDCAMQKKEVALNQVVVTALGISREKKSLGYAVQEISGNDVNTVKSENFISQLSGQVAGVQIQSNTNFGGSVNVLVRGASSLTGNNQALFVIDGVPIDNTIFNDAYQRRGGRGYDYGNGASDINPDDIKSITVLKGAAATALYGSRAANGVILITTKKGSASKGLGVSITSNYTIGIVDRSTFPKYQKEYGAGYGAFYSGTSHPGLEYWDWNGDGKDDWIVPTYEDASFGEKFDPNLMVYQWNSFYPGLSTYGKPLPWVAAKHDPYYFFNKSTSFSNSVDVSGGNDKVTYRLAYQNLKQTGIMPNSHLSKNNISLTGTYAMTKKLKVTTFANFINTSTVGRNVTGYAGNILSSFRQWWEVNVDILQQKQAYELLKDNATWNINSPFDLTPAYWNNYYFQRYENYENDVRNRFIGYTKLDWDVAKFLTLTARVSIDNYGYVQNERLAVGSISEAFGVGYPDQASGYALRTRNFNEMNYDLFARFHKDFSENLTFRGLLGTNIRRTKYNTLFASTNGGLAVPGLYTLANTKSPLDLPEQGDAMIAVNGYFANASVGIAKLLYLEGSIRMDQSSTLPLKHDTYFYPSVSASFLFSNLIKADWLSLGKFRINYAEVGNSAPYARLNDVYYQQFPFMGNGVATNGATKFFPDLKPEMTKSLEVGLTLNFFDNRLGLDIAAYNNNSIDQIMPVAISTATGYSRKYLNAGDMNNKGLEIMLKGTPVKTKTGLRWDVNLNWSKNVNKVVSLAEGVKNLQLASLQGGVTINARVGEPYGTIQGTDFLYQPGHKGDPNYRIVDGGYYAQTATSDQVIGTIQPDWIAGLRNTITYKNLSFSFLLDWKHGGDIFSLDMWYGMGTGLYPETAGLNDLGNPLRDPVTNDSKSGGDILQGVVVKVNGSDTTYVKNTQRSDESNFLNPHGWTNAPNALHVYDASYIKLREATITYRFPRKMFANSAFVKGASLSLVGSNLWILYKKLPYADPETSQGAGNIQGWQSGVMPSTRNIGFTLNVKF